MHAGHGLAWRVEEDQPKVRRQIPRILSDGVMVNHMRKYLQKVNPRSPNAAKGRGHEPTCERMPLPPFGPSVAMEAPINN